jgi:glycosyltransferase involved in cell wall biosynthesis
MIENPVDIELFIPPTVNTQNKKYYTVGIVARFCTEKDLPLFVKTAYILAKKKDNIQFMIVGDGYERKKIEKLAQVPELRNRIIFVGQTSDVPNFLRKFDLFLFTSKYELFGRAPLESLACEVPVVAALPERGGARQLLRELPGVLIDESRNPEILADAIIELLSDPQRRMEMAKAGRRYVVAKYSLEDWISKMACLYESLIMM